VGMMVDGSAGLTVRPALESVDGAVTAGPGWPALAARLGLGPGEPE
jgi:pilus assembly protein CpaF